MNEFFTYKNYLQEYPSCPISIENHAGDSYKQQSRQLISQLKED